MENGAEMYVVYCFVLGIVEFVKSKNILEIELKLAPHVFVDEGGGEQRSFTVSVRRLVVAPHEASHYVFGLLHCLWLACGCSHVGNYGELVYLVVALKHYL